MVAQSAEKVARRGGEGYGTEAEPIDSAVDDELVRERATTAREFDPAEIRRGAMERLILRS